MLASKRQIRGKLSKIQGDEYENLFRDQVHRDGFICIKIPPGCKTVVRNRWQRLIRIKSPFDFILSGPGKSSFIDVKAFSGSRITYSQITDHQAINLGSLESHGHKAGYVVFFVELRQVVFFPGSKLMALRKRQSLEIKDGFILGDFSGFTVNYLVE